MPGYGSSASTSEPTQSLQKVTGFPSFSSRILATGAKEYLESSLVTLSQGNKSMIRQMN